MKRAYIYIMVLLAGCNSPVVGDLDNSGGQNQIDIVASSPAVPLESEKLSAALQGFDDEKRDYFDIVKANYQNNFKVWGVSSEGGNIIFESSRDGVQVMRIELFGASGVTKVHLSQGSGLLHERVEFFEYTGQDNAISEFHIEIKEDGSVVASDSSANEEKFYSCLLQEIAHYTFNDVHGELSVSCGN